MHLLIANCCRCENKAQCEWLPLDLATIDASDLSLSFISSSAASALLHPVSVLTPCMMPCIRARCCSALLLCPFFTPTAYCHPVFKFSSSFSSSSHIRGSSSGSSGMSSLHKACSYGFCSDTHHHRLPDSLLSILVRSRRRRRMFLSLPHR